jgi:hypothetical protein
MIDNAGKVTTMKKRILQILLILFPYMHSLVFSFNIFDIKYSLVSWITLFILFMIANAIFVVWNVLHKGTSEFLLFWNMLTKLFYIPYCTLVFTFEVLITSYHGAILLAPFLIVIFYSMLLLTSIYGWGGLLKGWLEKKITTETAIVLGVSHFVLCADVVCAVIAYRKVKNKSKDTKLSADSIQQG